MADLASLENRKANARRAEAQASARIAQALLDKAMVLDEIAALADEEASQLTGDRRERAQGRTLATTFEHEAGRADGQAGVAAGPSSTRRAAEKPR